MTGGSEIKTKNIDLDHLNEQRLIQKVSLRMCYFSHFTQLSYTSDFGTFVSLFCLAYVLRQYALTNG